MPLPVVSPSLFNLQGLAADAADTHVQPGIHLRVNANPLLGLPVAPFIIWRAVAKGAQGVKFRSGGVFVDSLGRVLQPPFDLAPGNPVTAYVPLAAGETCIWASVRADPGGPRVGGVNLGLTTAGVRAVASPPAATIRERLAGARLDASRRVGDLLAPPADGGIAAQAFVSSVRGPAQVATRTAPPYAFNAPGIVQIELVGNGVVVGMDWLEAHDMPDVDFVPWGLLNLPHKGGARYLSIDGALLLAAGRVLNQAPKRWPLQETLGAVLPANAPPAGPADEPKRVDSLAAPLLPHLDALINDLSQSPFDQRVSAPIVDDTGSVIGTADQSRLDAVFQGQFDPGCAALFGYKARDRAFEINEPTLVFYWVTGFFRDFPPVAGQVPPDPIFDALLAALPAENRIGDEKSLVGIVDKLVQGVGARLNADTTGSIERQNDYIGLGALAVVDRSAPPDGMLAPTIDGHAHIGWIPMTPPAAMREVQVDLSDVGTGALLAAEKLEPAAGGMSLSLNKANVDGYHLPLALSMNVNDEADEPAPEPGTGFISDRRAVADDVRYFFAQQDRFGRWSNWASVVDAPGPRPRPPRPVLRGFYTQPADPAATGGTVRVQVDVPRPEVLAPASYLITELRVDATDLTLGSTSTYAESVGDPADPDDRIDFTFTGPLLAPTEQRKLRLVAVWHDSLGQDSVASEPLTLRMNDPRPPVQLTVPDQLQYTPRPDVTGLAMVEYAWTPPAGTSTCVAWYADENRLRAYLGMQPAGSPSRDLADELAAETDPAARATLLRNNGTLFPGHVFERLQGAVTDGPAGAKLMRHAVSGSLRVLCVYRLGTESATGARVDTSTLPLLIYAVPNADPPERPVLQVTAGDMTDNADTYAALLTVTLTPAATAADTWRLRRSNLGATDVQRMPIVGSGPMGAVEADGRQRATIADDGPVVIAPSATLQPWVRYHWVVQVQGGEAPGSAAAGRAVPGLWSAPSDPVSMMLVPPLPPDAATALVANGAALGGGLHADVVVTFEHAQRLSGGSIGAYTVRVDRRKPDQPMQTLGQTAVTGAGPFSVSGMLAGDASDTVPEGTLYRVVVIDPLGREGAPAETTLAPAP